MRCGLIWAISDFFPSLQLSSNGPHIYFLYVIGYKVSEVTRHVSFFNLAKSIINAVLTSCNPRCGPIEMCGRGSKKVVRCGPSFMTVPGTAAHDRSADPQSQKFIRPDRTLDRIKKSTNQIVWAGMKVHLGKLGSKSGPVYRLSEGKMIVLTIPATYTDEKRLFSLAEFAFNNSTHA